MGNKAVKESKTFHFFALAAVGEGLSGGDRIFIEFARRWSKWGHRVNIYVWQEGCRIAQAQKLKHKNINFCIINMGIWPQFGFIINYFARIIAGIFLGMTLRIEDKDYIYSASDFLMDSLPAFILKLRYPRSIWFAGWYQTAPNPLKGYAEVGRKRAYKQNVFFYWLSQRIARPIISRYSDFVLVNNENEKKQFLNLNNLGKVFVVLGAVPLEEIKNFRKLKGRTQKLIYDAVFQGRFHPQKGIVELIDIWKKVVQQISDSKLAIIGDGELMGKVKENIEKYQLNKNVKLFGYLYDGTRKYSIFQKSKIVVHPAFYDSGGMAAAEAMAFGIPAVGFDLESYKSYYPKGMIKVEKGDLEKFASAVIHLLRDESFRKRIGNEAREMIEEYWSWDKRAREILSKVTQK